MISTIRSLIPVGLMLLFLVKGTRGEKNLVYILMLPLLLVLGRSIFIDIYSMNYRILAGLLPISFEDILFLFVVIVWLYVRRCRGYVHRIGVKLEVLLVFLLLLYFLFEVVYSIVKGSEPYYVFGFGRIYFYIPLGFLLWVDVFRRFRQDEVKALLSTLSNLTVCVVLLYILSALGFGIYSYEPYFRISFSGTEIIRDFATFPYWALFAFIFILTKTRKSILDYLALLILILGVMFTYTRSWLIIVAVVLVMNAVLQFAEARKYRPVLQLVWVGVMVFIVYSVMGSNFRNYRDFLSYRFSEIEQEGVLGVRNLSSRIAMTAGVRSTISELSPAFGVGFFKERADVYRENRILHDIQWSVALFYLGIGGLSILGLILLNAVKDCVLLIIGRRSARFVFHNILFLAFVMLTSLSFVGPGVFFAYAVSMIYFSLLCVEKRQLWVSESPKALQA